MKSLLPKKWQIRNTNGDTIVEVLIAVAIVSLVLVGAYALSNKSSETLNDTRERQQALGLASGQVEYLRVANGLPTNTDCFDATGKAVAKSSVNCSYNSFNQNGCSLASSDFCYGIEITPVANSGGGSADAVTATTYKINVNWESLLGSTDEVALWYRVSVPNAAYVPPVVTPPGGGSVTPPGGGVGDPSIGGSSCPPMPAVYCQGNGGKPATKYNYVTAFVNRTTQIPEDQIAGCVWDFDDGTKINNQACMADGYLIHSFPTLPQQPFPKDCRGQASAVRTPYRVTLVIIKKDGSRSTTATYPTSTPYCY